jgi:hypothetical protein
MPRTRRQYTPADVDTALLVLALTGHNSVETARRLKSQGLNVNARTLRAWRTGIHSKRYAEIQRDHAPRIEAEMIGTAREIVLAANAATLEAIEATRDQVQDGEAKDPSAVARNLQTVAGIATDKALLTEGRPTVITGGDDVQALLARMNRLLGVVDSTAEDVTPPALES